MSKTWTRYIPDQDRDGLNACEERLLGTDDTLYDSDADGIPDPIEFRAGTNYLAVDPLQDADLDGMVNRDEIRGHTDPRTNDAQSQLGLAYRYEEVDEGLQTILSFGQPKNITGSPSRTSRPIPLLAWGGSSSNRAPADPRLAGLRRPGHRRQLRSGGGHHHAESPGLPAHVLSQGSPGHLQRGEHAQIHHRGCRGTENYPPTSLVEQINISTAKRNCIRFTVRNITLLETGRHRLLKTTGNNFVNVYFAQAPQRAKDGYGILRIASVQLNYHAGPPRGAHPQGRGDHPQG